MTDVLALPPVYYDYEPRQSYIVLTMPPAEQERACLGIKQSCTLPRRRVIVVSTELKGEALAIVLRHEKAHLNGWVHLKIGHICIVPHVAACID